MKESDPADIDNKWIPLDTAFLGMGLRLYEPDDRMVWEYFLSPLVRVMVAGDNPLISVRMPHRVKENGQIELLPSGRPADALVLREDLERAASNRYLFDSLAWTALDVGMRWLIPLYAQADTKSLPRVPERAIEPYRSMSTFEFRRKSREYLDQDYLNEYARMVEPTELFWPMLLRRPESFDILSPAWLVRRKNKVKYKDAVVAPLFAIRDVSLLPEWARDPWWFERNVRELVSLENYEIDDTVVGNQINRSIMRGREFFGVFNSAVSSDPALVMLYTSIEIRQRAFLRKLPFQHVALEQTRCTEPSCGVLMHHGRGKPKKYCPDCVAMGRNHGHESRERALHRDRDKRRHRGLR